MRVGIAHHFGWEGKPLDDAAAAALVAEVRESARRATAASLDELASDVAGPIVSMSLRGWPVDFPADIAIQRRTPYEAQADSIMYREVLAECARARGWDVELFDAKDVEHRAEQVLGVRAAEVLHGPRETLGPPWAKDHRIALAATIITG